MTPILDAVYEALWTRAQEPPFASRAQAWVDSFLERTGRYPNDQPDCDVRMAVAWDDAFCRGGLALQIAAVLEDPAEQQLAVLFSRAQRGVFSLERRGNHVLMHDRLNGGVFLVLGRDSVGREIRDDNAGGLCQARLVAAADGCAVLPGVVFHPPPASKAIEDVLRAARDEGLDVDDVCDALLRMDFALRTMSRPNPAFAFRSEALHPQPRNNPLHNLRKSKVLSK